MSLSKLSLKNRILAELQLQGFVTSGVHSKSDELVTAIANAVVDEIKGNAKVTIKSGSSSGSWPIN
ncbi:MULTISPECIES: hypothetical protein [Vibrio]|uniref:Uncharacterized protein n=1 Tax=Vibrio parahaemolyticus TaxID=670 RepID=A0AAW3ITY6_VIBPH|nr:MULTISPECIES: hypothetical protein [Vibrio]KOY26015.1 hypothetical protein ACX05_20240 [Vibrio parahaemolyticus]EKY4213284.1 hypothetical protein [Vibrio alginolyticus]KOF29491.1 hypothetical protein ACX09_16735 [Vibrio alginolyticus]MDW1855962.1 hypothetical protein [Vibrio sp. Vb0974]MDW2049908.1 hypothetical protein [Vibrio sp. 977]